MKVVINRAGSEAGCQEHIVKCPSSNQKSAKSAPMRSLSILICRSLLPGFMLLGFLVSEKVSSADQAFHIGLDFIDIDTELIGLPQAILSGSDPIVDTTYHPVALTSPTSFAVTQGGFAGLSELEVRESIRFQVEKIYRDVLPSGIEETLSINFHNGAVPTSAIGRRLNVVIGSNDLVSQLFGFSLGNTAYNLDTAPNDSYVAAVFANNLDSIGADPGVTFSSAESAIHNYAGTIAHEIGHLFGLDHQDVGQDSPHSLMAIGGTGLTLPQRLSDRRFNASSSSDLLALVPTSNRADFNMNGVVDIFQFNGEGDAQILTKNLGTVSGASLSDGDANSDGDVDVFQIDGAGDVQLLLSNLSVDAPSGVAEVFYNPHTGEIIFEIGEHIAVLGFQITGSELNTNLLPTLDGVAPAHFDAQTLAYFSFSLSASLPSGIYSQGKILPPGLAKSDIHFAYTAIGSSTVNSIATFIPEPATAILAGFAFSLFSCWRRHGR